MTNQRNYFFEVNIMQLQLCIPFGCLMWKEMADIFRQLLTLWSLIWPAVVAEHGSPRSWGLTSLLRKQSRRVRQSPTDFVTGDDFLMPWGKRQWGVLFSLMISCICNLNDQVYMKKQLNYSIKTIFLIFMHCFQIFHCDTCRSRFYYYVCHYSIQMLSRKML